jgi:hypothetical protein
MNRSLIFLLSSFVLIIVIFAVAIYIPNTLPVGSDFSALYYADLALVNGIHIYDIPAMEKLALEASGIPAENFFMPRFPYPPWYVLSTFYLGLLPIRSAGALWFQLNLIMLFVSIWLLTDGWDGRLRLIAHLFGLLFLPVIGALSVGQYGFPVLLGTSMLIYSLRRENVALTTLGVVLLTFKPHIGALILVSVLVWLIGSRSFFGRRALRSILIAGVCLFIIGFLADPAWPANYPNMLLNYQGEGNVTSCSECASIPVFASRWFWTVHWAGSNSLNPPIHHAHRNISHQKKSMDPGARAIIDLRAADHITRQPLSLQLRFHPVAGPICDTGNGWFCGKELCVPLSSGANVCPRAAGTRRQYHTARRLCITDSAHFFA